MDIYTNSDVVGREVEKRQSSHVLQTYNITVIHSHWTSSDSITHTQHLTLSNTTYTVSNSTEHSVTKISISTSRFHFRRCLQTKSWQFSRNMCKITAFPGHELTMWPIVCGWPHSHSSDAARPHLCKLAWHGPWAVQKRFSSVHD